MKPLLRSSGDILADRRATYAENLFASGDHAAAAELMAAALERAPDWVLGWFRLGEMHEASGAHELAAQAWRMVLKLDPDDHAGAALMLELLGQAPPSLASSSVFIETLFDQYAATFDRSLVEKLSYKVPELLSQAIQQLRQEREPVLPPQLRQNNKIECSEKRFACVVDLGCGTGLMGEKLRPVADVLEGYDISGVMLKKAEAKGCYDRLVKSDLQSLELSENSVDLITAADVFIYMGSLERIFGQIAKALLPGGMFCFSVECHDGPEDFILRPSRRYAHSRSCILRLLEDHNFAVASLARTTIRFDRGEPVWGMVVVAEADSFGVTEIQAA